MQIMISHYSGCGNDFLIIDDRSRCFEPSQSHIQTLCKGVDGLILAQLPTVPLAHFKMKFYNRDGSEADMCGNGLRCLGMFIKEKFLFTESQCVIETNAGCLKLAFKEHVTVEIGSVQELGWNISLSHEGVPWTLHHFRVGVPHLVTFVDTIDAIDVMKIGSFFRHHPHFLPAGANVNFVDPVKCCIRTFERGVEAETLACGTGSTAAAFALHKLYGHVLPIKLKVRSGEYLEVGFTQQNATLSGPVTWVRDM